MNSSLSSVACGPFTLPSNGLLIFSNGSSLVLDEDTTFRPACNPSNATDGDDPLNLDGDPLQDPFYASIIPQTMVISGCTILAFTILILVLVTPRPDRNKAKSAASRAGIMRGATAPGQAVTNSGRPWLQKLAAGFVVISLLIAISRATEALEDQYQNGFSNAAAVRDAIVDGTAIKVVRITSDTFIWLALIQTVIRVLPRHRERIITKWCGFCLVVVDVVFSILAGFLSSVEKELLLGSRSLIATLSYLFQFVLSLLYALAIAYYSFRKRRFAFYHPQSKNIVIIAAISMIATLVPIIFFIIDLLGDKLAIWGDYVRWVGAAAASIVVWEWAERIELLEREERNDGVLGRQLRDDDDSFGDSPMHDLEWFKGYQRDHGPGGRLTSVHGRLRERSPQRRGSRGWRIDHPPFQPSSGVQAAAHNDSEVTTRSLQGPTGAITNDVTSGSGPNLSKPASLQSRHSDIDPPTERSPVGQHLFEQRHNGSSTSLNTLEEVRQSTAQIADTSIDSSAVQAPGSEDVQLRDTQSLSHSNTRTKRNSRSAPDTQRKRRFGRLPRALRISRRRMGPVRSSLAMRVPRETVVIPAPEDGEIYRPDDLVRMGNG